MVELKWPKPKLWVWKKLSKHLTPELLPAESSSTAKNVSAPSSSLTLANGVVFKTLSYAHLIGSLPLKLHEKQTIYFCCDRAYLTNEAYQSHKSSRELHNKKALNLLNIRMALNERDSGTFWRLRKAKSTKNYNEDGDEEEEEEEGCEDNDVTGHEGHDGGGDDEPDASIQALAEAEYGQNNDEYEDVEEKPK